MKINLQNAGHVRPGVPQIATGYVKMLPENDITGSVITSENWRQSELHNRFYNVKTGAHATLNHNRF